MYIISINMYNTNYNCLYKKKDIFDEQPLLTEDQMISIRDDLYRNDVLNIFNLNEYDEEKLSKELDDIYETLTSCKILLTFIEKIIEHNGYEKDLKWGIIFLFTYENLHLFHPCISDYILYNKISSENLIKLNTDFILC